MRRLQRIPVVLFLLVLSSFTLFSKTYGEECTTAVITAAATSDGRPILWKNRDTDQLSNKVIFVDEKPYSYLAVVNAEDTSGRVAWGGLNSAGFAIINSVAYNLPDKTGEMKDLEGMIMAEALRSCATAEDFERYLQKNLGPSLGARTNFVVIDARGGAAIFETHNHGTKRLDAKDAPERYLLNTNFSRSGTADKGAGYIRFDRETTLFNAVASGKLSKEFILQTVARDLGHPLVQHPAPEDWKKLPDDKPYWIHSNYTINRPSTASAILIQGVKEGEDPRKATLWVILGEPVTSIALPFWVGAGETPAEVREGKDAPVVHEADRLKEMLHPLKGRDRYEYLDVTRLDNRSGTGWLPGNLKVEKEIFEQTMKFLEQNPTPSKQAAFEKEMAEKALARLREIH
jgi:hypothetical protein